MREKQIGYLGIEETVYTISIARRTMTPKIKKGPRGVREKNLQKIQSQRYFDGMSVISEYLSTQNGYLIEN